MYRPRMSGTPLVNFRSSSGLSGGGATNPLPNISAYAASKAAVVRLMETLAEELRPAFVGLIEGGKFVPNYAEIVSSTPQHLLDKAKV